MTRRCELTGKLPMSGQLRSHAENKTKRTFRPNLCEVTLISDALQRKVRLRISAHALKTVEQRGGLDAFLLKATDEELSERCQKLQARGEQGPQRRSRPDRRQLLRTSQAQLSGSSPASPRSVRPGDARRPSCRAA